ncbi:enoyl-CoA hydratase [Myxococcaceae bacterium]|jgi:enoyl-CoA hydratase|nr:enoyl-CoA hydratase [Myxococcaceae bacterium]
MISTPLLRYELAEGIATITLDDGKANVMSERMQAEIAAALDRAERDRAVVLLRGRPRIFSGGYDLAMFGRSAEEAVRTIRSGGELVHRLLGFRRPVVALCTGHAVAQGAFLLLAADVRIGVSGAFKIGLNEVTIGLTMPHYGVEIARLRLTAPWFNHATTTGTLYAPEDAARAGFLDRVADEADALRIARDEALTLTRVHAEAHAGTKLRVRRHALDAMQRGIAADFAAA